MRRLTSCHIYPRLSPRVNNGRQDRQFFPVLVANARRGKTKYAIGDGKNVADFTFVGNVAHAHLLAAEKVSGPILPAARQAEQAGSPEGQAETAR